MVLFRDNLRELGLLKLFLYFFQLVIKSGGYILVKPTIFKLRTATYYGKSPKNEGRIILADHIEKPGGKSRINAQRCGLKEFKKDYWATVVEGCKLI